MPRPALRPAPRPRCRVPALAVAVFLLAASPAVLPAQTAVDLNEGLRLFPVPDVPGAYEVSWWGRSGYSYFIQQSTDLNAAWSYLPVIKTGQDAVLAHGISDPSPRIFVRLSLIETPLTDPYLLDSDGDGLTNQQEFTHETDPFATDTDSDGLPDNWELDHGLNPRNPTDAFTDPDGDGRSTAQEFLEGSDPALADTSPPYTGSTPTPSGLTVEELASGTLRVRWTGSTTGTVRGYLVERSSDFVTWALIGLTVGNTTIYDDTRAQPGVAYAYRVAGVY
jgi:hypothetical protein